jgi:hypothetical protein
VVTDALKKYREIFAYGLLAVAALYLISGLSLLFKSENGLGVDFSAKAAAFGYVFAHPILVLSVVGAVALAVGFGEVTRNARIIVLAALAIAGVALLLALITFFASFGADDSGFAASLFGGVIGAGRIVGMLLGLAQLLLLGLAAWFAITALRALPRTSPRAASWGQPQGYPGAQGYGQPGWGQQDTTYGQQQGWGPQPAPGWPAGPGTGATAVGGAATGWGEQYQGQPASAWGNAESAYTGLTEGQPPWGDPGRTPQQWTAPHPSAGGQQWAPPEPGHPAERHGSTAAAADPSQWERSAGEPEQPPQPEGEEPPQRGWWQGREQ